MIRPPPCSTPFPYTTLFRSHCKKPERREFEKDGYLRHAPGEPFARANKKRHAGPAPVVHLQAQRDIALRVRIRRDSFLLRSEEHTSELQSRRDLVCRLLLEK